MNIKTSTGAQLGHLTGLLSQYESLHSLVYSHMFVSFFGVKVDHQKSLWFKCHIISMCVTNKEGFPHKNTLKEEWDLTQRCRRAEGTGIGLLIPPTSPLILWE